MRNADVCNQRDVRPHQIGKPLNLAEIIHTHFEDSDFGVLREFENAQRQSETVVEVFHASGSFVFCPQRVIEHVTRTRLANTSGHRDLVAQRQHGQVVCRQILQGARGIFNHDNIRFLGGLQKRLLRNFFRLGYDQRTTAAAQRAVQIQMPVGHLPLEREKNISCLGLPGIRRDFEHMALLTATAERASCRF